MKASTLMEGLWQRGPEQGMAMEGWGASFGWANRRRRPPELPSRQREAARPNPVREKVEPVLAGLIGNVVAGLRAGDRPAVSVLDAGGRRWAPAYVLGSLQATPAWAADRTAFAEVVLDGSGRLVLGHAVTVAGSASRPMPVSCPSLAGPYEALIRGVRITNDSTGGAVFCTTAGVLMLAGASAPAVPLADYLNALAQTPPAVLRVDAWSWCRSLR